MKSSQKIVCIILSIIRDINKMSNIINLDNFDFNFLQYCLIFINNSKGNSRNDFFVMFKFQKNSHIVLPEL